jgi:hypothetical protein
MVIARLAIVATAFSAPPLDDCRQSDRLRRSGRDSWSRHCCATDAILEIWRRTAKGRQRKSLLKPRGSSAHDLVCRDRFLTIEGPFGGGDAAPTNEAMFVGVRCVLASEFCCSHRLIWHEVAAFRPSRPTGRRERLRGLAGVPPRTRRSRAAPAHNVQTSASAS